MGISNPITVFFGNDQQIRLSSTVELHLEWRYEHLSSFALLNPHAQYPR
jgi:hypothetical protein